MTMVERRVGIVDRGNLRVNLTNHSGDENYFIFLIIITIVIDVAVGETP